MEKYQYNIRLTIMSHQQQKMVANLSNLSKVPNSSTPKNSENSVPQQIPQQNNTRTSNVNDYQTMATQYTTNYNSIPSNTTPKNIRSYKNDIHFLQNQQYPEQFLAYCIAVKQSNLGIYSNERFFVLDSQKKQFKYYSQIPTLPLVSPEDLKVLPKEIIKLDTGKKFTFAPEKNGIGQVQVKWNNEQQVKQWRIVMNSRRIAIQLGVLIEKVKNNNYFTRKSSKKLGKSDNSGSKQVIRKLSQVRQTEIQRRKNSLISQKSYISDNQIVNRDSNIQLQQFLKKRRQTKAKQEFILTQIAQQKINSKFIVQEVKTTLREQAMEKDAQKLVKKKDPQQQKSEQIQKQKQMSRQLQPSSIVENKQQRQLQITLKQIIQQAEKQHEARTVHKIFPTNQRFIQLQNILSNKPKRERNSKQLQQKYRQRESIIIIKKIIQQDKNSRQSEMLAASLNAQQNERKIELVKQEEQKSIYQQVYIDFQRVLQQNRRQQDKNDKIRTVSFLKGKPKRESTKQKQRSYPEQSKIDILLTKWMLSKDSYELATVYATFIEQCQLRVNKLAYKFNDWHLWHKTGQQFHFEDEGIQLRYVMLSSDPNNTIITKRQQYFQKDLKNWSHLLRYVKEYQQQILFAVPLACIICYNGLKVFCKAVINMQYFRCSVVEDIQQYSKSLKQLQKLCKISLNKSEFYDIRMKQMKILYFNQSDNLPAVSLPFAKQIIIDENYLKKYIQQGVVRNNLDIQQINRHVNNKLIKTICKRLNKYHLTSCLELEELFNEYGINAQFLGELFRFCQHKKYLLASTYLGSEIISICIAQIIRVLFHQHIKRQFKYTFQTFIFQKIQSFLREDPKLKQQISQIMKDKFGQLQINYKSTFYEYIVASTLFKLQVRCDFKYDMSFASFEQINYNAWSKIQFDNKHVNIYPIINSIKYNQSNFIKGQKLGKYIFKGNIQFSQEFTIKEIQSQINPFQKSSFRSSSFFKILNLHNKCKLNFYYSHFYPPQNRSLGISFSSQTQELYFNLYHHSTSYFLCCQNFGEDMIGIKWLIKKQKFEEADRKLFQQRQRVWIWGRNNPRLLLQIHDLQSLYAHQRGNLIMSAQKSLTSLQLSLHFFQQTIEQNWKLIWEKAFSAANISFQASIYDQSYSLYEICSTLIDKMQNQQLQTLDINTSFLSIYRKQATVKLAEGKANECLQRLKMNIEKLKKWRDFFSGDRFRIDLCKQIENQVYNNLTLMLRCYQIKNQYQSYCQILSNISKEYFQKDWNEFYLSNPKFKLSEIFKWRLSDLTKNIWFYLVNDVLSLNQQLRKQQKTQISFNLIYNHILQIKQHNKGYYRYTSQQLYRFIVQRYVSFEANQKYGFKFIPLIIHSLSELSKSNIEYKRCKLYDENSHQNHLLILQSLTYFIGYQYCLGIIDQVIFNKYQFSF